MKLGRYVNLPVAKYVKVPLKRFSSDQCKLWITRENRWVTTMVQGHGHHQFLRLTNVSDRDLILHDDIKLGIWLAKGRVPRAQGFVSVRSKRYAERQNLAYQAITDEDASKPSQEKYQGSMVERLHTRPQDRLCCKQGLRYQWLVQCVMLRRVSTI